MKTRETRGRAGKRNARLTPTEGAHYFNADALATLHSVAMIVVLDWSEDAGVDLSDLDIVRQIETADSDVFKDDVLNGTTNSIPVLT